MILTLLCCCGASEKGCIQGHCLVSGSQKPFTITSDAWLYLHRIQSKKTDPVVTRKQPYIEQHLLVLSIKATAPSRSASSLPRWYSSSPAWMACTHDSHFSSPPRSLLPKCSTLSCQTCPWGASTPACCLGTSRK